MRLPSHRQCAVEGDGKKMDQAPPFRNPFVHVLKFTPLEKAKVNPRLHTNDLHVFIYVKVLFIVLVDHLGATQC